jgi:hypothetical protein
LAIVDSPALVETEATVSDYSDKINALLHRLRRQIGDDAALLEQLRDELRILSPSLASVVDNARFHDSILAKHLAAHANSLKSVLSVAASLTAQEEALRNEVLNLSFWERTFGLVASYESDESASSALVVASCVAQLSPSQAQSQSPLTTERREPSCSRSPPWPQILCDVLSAAEADARQTASSLCAAQLAGLQADAEAQLAAVRSVGEQRVREAALEAETLLGAEFDASMSLRQSRLQSAQSQREALEARLSSIAYELDAQRRLRLLKAQTRRLWASMQPAKLSLALDCDSEGWASENDAGKDSSPRIDDVSTILEMLRHEKFAADDEHARALDLVKAEEHRLKRQRASPLVSLGIFSSSSNAAPTTKNHTTDFVNSLPLSSAERRATQTIARLVELTPAASNAASTAQQALASSTRLAEAEARAAQHKLRRERRACARVLIRAQSSRRAAAAVLAGDVADAVMEDAFLSNKLTSKSLAVDDKKEVERNSWHASVLHLGREQRMRVAVCRFLSGALRESPYNAQFAIVLSVAKRVADRLRGGYRSESGRGTASLLGVIAKIVGEAEVLRSIRKTTE